jgi:general secretion pathway protein E
MRTIKMNIEELENPHLEPYELGDSELALKNKTLFSMIDGVLTAVTYKEYMAEAFDYLSKVEESFEFKFVDEESYNRLYNRFLELKSSRALTDINEKDSDSEDSFELDDFLQISSDILTSESSAPIIKFVNSLFYQSVKKGASDIHIEQHEFNGEVRFRIDGVLNKELELEKKIVALVVSRIKVISNLDISEKRIPQDGRTQIKIGGKNIDIRVSILPTYYGERVVMRLLMESADIPHLKDLGFDKDITAKLSKLVKNPHGMLLVTGPTGSGKSTTLHALIQEIADPHKNIITVEDPVEYKSDNISQIQVNEKAGLTFAAGLRSILRQDPDIIMVGEIRDEETASISVQSALTGHLVFSTLHTNDATSAVIRLMDMGVEKFLISSSVLGVLAQRLVRLLCTECKQRDTEHHIPHIDTLYTSIGCKTCNYTGYHGRRAIAELFVMDKQAKDIIKHSDDEQKLREDALSRYMQSISDKLEGLLEKGDISLEEAIRVGYVEK